MLITQLQQDVVFSVIAAVENNMKSGGPSLEESLNLMADFLIEISDPPASLCYTTNLDELLKDLAQLGFVLGFEYEFVVICPPRADMPRHARRPNHLCTVRSMDFPYFRQYVTLQPDKQTVP